MRRLFSYDGPIYRFLSTIADLILLNILWIVCSIPIITIGISTTALHYACQKQLCGEGHIFKDFFSAFRRNFKQATIVWMLIMMIAVSFFLDYSLLISLVFPGKMVIVSILWMLIVLCFMAAHYVFPLIAQFENTTRNVLSNSILLLVQNIPTSLLICLPTIIIAYLLVYNIALFIRIGIVWFLLGASVPAFYQTKLISKVFQPFLLKNR